MAIKTISLELDAYERLKRAKRGKCPFLLSFAGSGLMLLSRPEQRSWRKRRPCMGPGREFLPKPSITGKLYKFSEVTQQ